MDHIQNEKDRINANIFGSYSNDFLEKGKGGGAPIGTIKKFGGREYIKTADGWKYHGKGGGKEAQGHVKQVVGNGGAIKTSSKGEYTTTTTGPAAPDPEDETSKIAKEKTGDINFRFKMFAAAVKGVISGKFKSCIAYGTGGVGKTYTVIGQLLAAGKKEFDAEEDAPGDDTYDFVKITGRMTAPQVYKAMYQHNGKILLFDDCDSVLTDSNAINLFKGALDSSGDGTISYATTSGVKDDEGEKLPTRFKFNGRAIFISNLAPHVMPQPLKSRAVGVDLTMDKKQTLERIKEIAKHPKTGKYQNLKFPGIDAYTHEDMAAVINYLDKNKEHISDLNVRTVGKVLGLKQIAEEMGEKKDWERYADQTIFSKGESFDYNGGIWKSRSQFVDQLYKSQSLRTYDIKKSSDVESDEDVDSEVEKGEESKQLIKGEMNEIDASFNELFKSDSMRDISNEQKRQQILATYGVGGGFQKSEDSELQKGGEGSKGGKVIGHSAAGNPIYANVNGNMDHKDRAGTTVHSGVQASKIVQGHKGWGGGEAFVEHGGQHVKASELKEAKHGGNGKSAGAGNFHEHVQQHMEQHGLNQVKGHMIEHAGPISQDKRNTKTPFTATRDSKGKVSYQFHHDQATKE